MATISLILAAIAVFIAAWFLGLREDVGSWILNRFFPTTYPLRGSQVEIYIDGQHNRRATVTASCYDFLVFYDAVRCPIDYRGRFYGIGEDANGHTLVYVDDVRHWHLVGRAERIRKFCHVPNEFATFVPYDDNRPMGEILSAVSSGEQKKSEISVEGIL